ncbi:hypothetical protein [Inquilinus sp.]|uniref:hypothetical protein n=1 Tax=Inquilinus sp. TaxID=1932117 RepID=UPI0031D0E105
MSTDSSKAPPPGDEAKDRREFLAKCGRFAIVTPPAVTLLLSTSLTSDAIAKSGGGHGHGHGEGHGHGHDEGHDEGHNGTPPGRDGNFLEALLGKLF